MTKIDAACAPTEPHMPPTPTCHGAPSWRTLSNVLCRASRGLNLPRGRRYLDGTSVRCSSIYPYLPTAGQLILGTPNAYIVALAGSQWYNNCVAQYQVTLSCSPSELPTPRPSPPPAGLLS